MPSIPLSILSLTHTFTSDYLLLTAGVLIFIAYASVRTVTKKAGSRFPRPPGPKGYPIIGNLFDVPKKRPWLIYDQYIKKYGDLVYLNILGQSVLVLGSIKRTTDLFEKRSSKYSDRPRMPMLVELMHYDSSFSNQPYGLWWRRHRRAFHQHFNLNVISNYHPIESREIRKFLSRLLTSPERFEAHTENLLASIIVDITYGIEMVEENDTFISEAQMVAESFHIAGVPGKFLVDTFPLLKYVPSWVPGAGFKKFAERYAAIGVTATNKPFDFVVDAMKNGVANECVATRLIDALPELGSPRRQDEEVVIRNTTAMAYLAGSDTTIGSALAFILAMAIHPDFQRKAQLEIDEVVGPGRLPDFKDRGRLVYVNAIMKEVLRWHQVTPLALPHAVSEDDIYDGYFIPKGTIVIGSAWSILHDAELYPDPLEFNPERYIKDGQLDPTIPDPSIAAFGFGRRMCPGRYLSNDTLYAMVSSTLAVFDIKPQSDDLKAEFTDGALSHPQHFDCIITPRSADAKTFIQNLSEM